MNGELTIKEFVEEFGYERELKEFLKTRVEQWYIDNEGSKIVFQRFYVDSSGDKYYEEYWIDRSDDGVVVMVDTSKPLKREFSFKGSYSEYICVPNVKIFINDKEEEK